MANEQNQTEQQQQQQTSQIITCPKCKEPLSSKIKNYGCDNIIRDVEENFNAEQKQDRQEAREFREQEIADFEKLKAETELQDKAEEIKARAESKRTTRSNRKSVR